jgi:hypothetical protein
MGIIPPYRTAVLDDVMVRRMKKEVIGTLFDSFNKAVFYNVEPRMQVEPYVPYTYLFAHIACRAGALHRITA